MVEIRREYTDDERDDDRIDSQPGHVSDEDDDDEDDGDDLGELEEENRIKDMQDAINDQHPFGLKIWKPALYKKVRSVEFTAYNDLHSTLELTENPGLLHYISFGNVLWTLLFSWWIALLYLIIALLILGPISLFGYLGISLINAIDKNLMRVERISLIRALSWTFTGLRNTWLYAKVLINLSSYVFWPFGKFVAKRRLHYKEGHDGFEEIVIDTIGETVINIGENNAPSSSRTNTNTASTTNSHHQRRNAKDDYQPDDEDGMSESSLLLPEDHPKRRTSSQPTFFQRVAPAWMQRLYSSGLSGFLFCTIASVILAPIHLVATFLGFFMVFSVPIARLNFVLLKHILRHPLRIQAYTIAQMRNSPEAPAFLRAHNLACRMMKPESTRELSQQSSDESTPSIPSAPSPRATPTLASFRPYSIAISDTSEFPVLHPTQAPPHNILRPPFAHSTQGQQSEYIIILSIRYAMGLQYYKYTLDGINLLFVNFLAVVIFTLVDFYIIGPRWGYTGIAGHNVIFGGALLSVIPLAYFIGMAVSSITAQTGSLALGAVINASFGSIVEVLLYVLALREGKERMVEGSIIGSFLCGILALPGSAMLSGGLVRKEQKFNSKSAGVSSVLMIMALIGAFTPTLFQQIYGSFELRCNGCPVSAGISSETPQSVSIICKSCHYAQPHPTQDPLYMTSTRPLMYICASVLLLTYAIGLWFTLRTHSKQIYATKFKAVVREDHLNATIWKQIVKHQRQQTHEDIVAFGKRKVSAVAKGATNGSSSSSLRNREGMASPRVGTGQLRYRPHSVVISGLEVTPDAFLSPAIRSDSVPDMLAAPPTAELDDLSSLGSAESEEDATKKNGKKAASGGHGGPNWGTAKSTGVLLISTLLFSAIAEVLIDSVDEILNTYKGIDEKFLGLTLFALIPSVTEFYNAIAFAMQGNIVLALEIGSAYTIQVALLQIPALVAFSAWYSTQPSSIKVATAAPNPALRYPGRHYESLYRSIESWYYAIGQHSTSDHSFYIAHKNPTSFTLIFPRWDVYAVLFATFILTYIYIEGKSNYFKGSMLLLAYFVLVSAFWFAPTHSFLS